MSYSPEQTVFTLNAPVKPVVRIYPDAQNLKASKTVKMKRAGENVWKVAIKGDLKNKFYTFDIGKGETPGVFATAVGVNGRRGAIIDHRQASPDGWQTDRILGVKSPTDLVIYELHHRDFSVDMSSGLRHKGKFLALTEPKAIGHLKELGITAVHILPSFDYASVDETRLDMPQYNWGYDPLNYNVPEGSYSTNPYDPATRILEFRKMVMELHRAGIRVFLDVVYNHTFDLDGSNFQRTFPNAYYRFTADGKPSNGSGCGNETASDRVLMRQYMLASFKYWAEEYHIDGFRVDLMGVHDIETMNAVRAELDKVNPGIFLYGEGWSAGSCAYPQEKLAMKAHMRQMPSIAAFSDNFRDALRGPFSDDRQGAFLAGIPGEEESLKFGLVGGVFHPQVDMSKVNYDKQPWAAEPTQHISYVSCHDDMCLVDRLRTELPGISDEELIRLDLLAQTAVFTSQGVPFMLSGEEMLRDKKGVHNSYNSPDSVNRLDWTHLKKYPQVFDYYKGLIALRKRYPAFRLGTADGVRRGVHFMTTEPCLVAYRLRSKAQQGDIYVVLNANKEARKVKLPEGVYRILCYNGRIDPDGTQQMAFRNGHDEVNVPAQSALILMEVNQ